MTHRPISTNAAPAAIGPYSQAIASGDLVFCAGQVGLDPATGELVSGGIEAQTERAIRNLGAVLDAAGLGYAHVVKSTVYLVDLEEFGAMNAVYARFFSDPWPARATVGIAALPRGARIEIDAIAARPQRRTDVLVRG
jgi:2-iminobutanoate/2-iminopropanoate deaminase